ncbi:alpha/beta hydrolase [Staphylococcus sp. SS87]|nr:alpha/beta hydrolase [Staphylococcus singaporensis]
MDLFTRKDGTSLHYSTLGEGYPIVLIHTVLDNYSVFNKLAAELAKSFQVVLIDLRGHGYSDKPRHIDIHDFADDIVALLKYLYIEEVSLICHEMAGFIGADMSVRYPQHTSSLVLVNPTSIEGELPEERLFRKYAHIIRNWDPEKQDKFLNKRKYYRPRKMNRFLKHVEDTNEISTKEEIQAVKDVFKRQGISKVYSDVEVPTMIVAGEFGERTTRLEAKEVADLIQNVDFKVYQESSAFPFVEEQEKFVEDATIFINEHHENKHV